MQVFLNRQAVEMCLSMIKEYSEKYKFWVWAYCFMPDHLHLLVEGNNEYSDFKKFISHGKRIGLRESRLIRLES
ncbi:MAG: transposase [Candidatus Stahlbacteria bacterium]|nr:transposase [Candidatus Stahlbacteria bacterium]